MEEQGKVAEDTAGKVANLVKSYPRIETVEGPDLGFLGSSELFQSQGLIALALHTANMDAIEDETRQHFIDVGDMEDARHAEAKAKREKAQDEADDALAESAERQRSAAMAVIEGLGAMAGGLATFFEAIAGDSETMTRKQFNRIKALKIAEAVINTFASANMALSNPPGPPYTIPFMLAAVATGSANVAKIAQSKYHAGGTPAQSSMAPDERLALVRNNEDISTRQQQQAQGPQQIMVTQVYKHRSFGAFVADNVRISNSPLRNAIKGRTRVGQRGA
jgi:hypothetical protein